MDDDFNSSDIEFEEPAKPHFRAGIRSIKSMTKSRTEDRKTTKKRAKTLQDTRGAPGSIYMRHLWLNRLEGYVRMNNISVDSTTGPRAKTIMRCMETVVDHMKPLMFSCRRDDSGRTMVNEQFQA